MSAFNKRIAAVLDDRRRLRPAIDAEIARWERVRQVVGRLDTAVTAVREDAASVLPAIGADDLDITGIDRQITEVLAALSSVRARVSRQTVNIGVGGRARNGKSTLLQSLTGLGDEQIPAGAGQPVTAVRSRIFHSDDASEAWLTLHTEASFLAEVVGGFHTELGFASVPGSIDEFVATTYPAAEDLLGVPEERRPEFAPLLARLREMQQSADGYRNLLTGRTIRVELADLRKWVAYPDHADPMPDRRYLAVREARIMCRFPVDDIGDVCFVDMPGLGDISPAAEAHHLIGLQNDVDFVMVVKRPTDTNAAWFAEDARGLGLVARAAGAAGVRDFLLIVVNDGGVPRANVDALLADIDARVNENRGDPPFRRVVADAADASAVQSAVFEPVLDHLAEALPRMDNAVIDRARALSATLRRSLLATTGSIQQVLRRALVPTAVDELLRRSEELQAEVAEAVQDWTSGLEAPASEGYEDTEFLEHVDQLRSGIREWVMDAFGEGAEAWTGRAVKAMRIDRGSVRFALDEIDAIRVEISARLSAVDDLLDRRREEFWAGLVGALGPRLVPVPEGGPRQALEDFATRLREAPEPCPALADSVDFVLDVRLDYRTRVMPRMRRALAVLRPEQSGRADQVGALTVPPNPDGAAELLGQITNLARQGVHEASSVLAAEPSIIADVLLAFGEQFEDAFVRSAASRSEFRRMAEAFRDQLWPGGPSGPALATARVQHLRSVLRDLSESLGDSPESEKGTVA